MGQPVLVQLSGAVKVESVVDRPSLQDVMQLNVRASYGASKSARVSIQATDDDPYVMPLEGIAKVRFLCIQFSGTSMRLRLTTPNGGTLQVVPLSEVIVLHAPNAGDEVTALSIVGTGSFQYLIAGDVS